MSRERGKIGAHIAVHLRTAMHTADATGGEHRDSGERGECQRCRYRRGADGPPFGDCDCEISLRNLARWPEDALVLGVVKPDSRDSVDHGSHRRYGTMRAHRSDATIERFAVCWRGQSEVGENGRLERDHRAPRSQRVGDLGSDA